MSRRFELTDAEWELIAPLLPSRQPRRGGRWRDHRQVINGILWRVRTGAPWRDVPDRYGPWRTLYKRFARWEHDGTGVVMAENPTNPPPTCSDVRAPQDRCAGW